MVGKQRIRDGVTSNTELSGKGNQVVGSNPTFNSNKYSRGLESVLGKSLLGTSAVELP